VFSRMHVRTLILSAFGGVALACLAMGGVALVASLRLSSHLSEVAEQRLPSAEVLGLVGEGQADVARVLAALVHQRLADPGLRRREMDRAEAALVQIEAAGQAFESYSHEQPARDSWRSFQAAQEAWRREADRTMELLRERDRLAAAGKPMESAEQRELYERTWEAWTAQARAYAATS